MSSTHGTGIMQRAFRAYEAHRGDIDKTRRGVLVSTADGEAMTYALRDIQSRGILFISAAEKIYQGMIVGEHSRDADLRVNPCRAKQQSNVRDKSPKEM